MNNLVNEQFEPIDDDIICFLQSDDPFIDLLAMVILSRGKQKLLERIPSKVHQYDQTMANYNHSIKRLLKAACEYYPD
ncbi:MAG: hypothetical protein WCP01_16335 [Methylococcaceae bacterium]